MLKDDVSPYQQAMTPLLEALPLELAMKQLVVDKPIDPELVALCQKVVSDPVVANQPALCAGLWLYVDELDRSHEYSQSLKTPEGSYWHAIMHRREGDFSNSKYWYHRVGAHHVFESLDLSAGGCGGGTDVGGYDPYVFVDRVEQDGASGRSAAPDLLAMQRLEWVALMEWCAKQ